MTVDTRLPAAADVPDPFRWLEDATDPRTVAWVREQDEAARRHLDALPALPAMRARLVELLGSVRTESAPRVHGRRRFRARRDRDRPNGAVESSVDGGPWRTVVDPRTHPDLGPGTSLSSWEVSPGGEVLAVQVIRGGVESATPLHLLDGDGGAPLAPPVPHTRYSSVLWLDDRRFVYSRQADGRPGGVRLYTLPTGTDGGTDGGTDTEVFALDVPDLRYHLTVWQGRWLAVSARAGADPRNRVWIVDLTGSGAVHPVQPEPDAATQVMVVPGGRVLMSTTLDAPGGRVVAAGSPDRAARPWRTLVEPDPEAVVMGVVPAPGGLLALVRTRLGAAEITLHDEVDGRLVRTVTTPGRGTIRGLRGDGSALRLTYTDWVTPPSTWTLDGAAGALEPLGPATARLPVAAHVTAYPSDDVEVPITVLHPAGEGPAGAPDRPRPTMLTCYGGFGITRRPGFEIELLAWVLGGGVVAVAGVRGGGDRGTGWHAAGRGEHKPNSFRDLAAAETWLVEQGWTDPGGLCLTGSSNGGLVVSGTLVRHPERLAAAICLAPLTDMVRFEHSGLGARWRHEYGTADDPHQLRTLLGYSPYHNVVRGRQHPPTLLMAGDADTRVDPLHSRKLAAMLQDADPLGGPVLFRSLAGTGHGDSDAEQGLQMAAATLAFLARHTGLDGGDAVSGPAG